MGKSPEQQPISKPIRYSDMEKRDSKMTLGKAMDKRWEEWESLMKNAQTYFEASRDLGATIHDASEDTVLSLSSEKIQATIDQLEEAKRLAEYLEFLEEFEQFVIDVANGEQEVRQSIINEIQGNIRHKLSDGGKEFLAHVFQVLTGGNV